MGHTKEEINRMHELLSELPRMYMCENRVDTDHLCIGRIERNHALFYSGRKIEEPYALRALCTEAHRGNNGTIYRRADLVCKVNAILEGLEHLKQHYPSTDWEQELKRYQYQLKKSYE